MDVQNTDNHCGQCDFSCLGGCENGQCKVDVAKITAGRSHSCAVLANGEVMCWGRNHNHQIGPRRDFGDYNGYAMRIPEIDNAVGVSLGANHSCALLDNKTVKCWGYNGGGELGNGSTSYRYDTPQLVSNLSQVTQLVSGISHTCALRNNGEVLCWGSNTQGKEPSLRNNLKPVIHLAAGQNNTCALHADDTVTCWGHITNFQTILDQVNGIAEIAMVHSGHYSNAFACALVNDGTIHCGGINNEGQLGDGTTLYRPEPITVPTSGSAKAISLGTKHGCALLNSNQVQCWGNNEYGQLGIEGDTNILSPTDVPGLGNVTQLALGDNHSCALLQNGLVKCWGDNQYDQLGGGHHDEMRILPSVVYSQK